MSQSKRSEQKTEVRPDGSLRVITVLPDDSPVDQSFKQSTDINNIIHKYKKTQLWPGRNVNQMYMDWAAIPDFKESMDTVAKAQSQFNDLPAHIRARFKNDPSNLLDFVADPKNQKEAIELGLAHPSTVPSSNNDDSTTMMRDNKKTDSTGLPASPGAPAPQP